MDLHKNTSTGKEKAISQLSREMDKINSIVAYHYGIYPHDIMNKSRTSHESICRQVAYYMADKYLRKKLSVTIMQIASFYGKHHATFLYSVRKIQSWFDIQYPPYIQFLRKVDNHLKKEYEDDKPDRPREERQIKYNGKGTSIVPHVTP